MENADISIFSICPQCFLPFDSKTPSFRAESIGCFPLLSIWPGLKILIFGQENLLTHYHTIPTFNDAEKEAL